MRGAEGLSAPMIGRDEELVVLDALASRVERERAPQLVTTYGHAGVGKTRLLDEFVATLDNARVLHGRCLPYGEGITYWPLGEAAKGYAGILDSDSAHDALAKLEATVAADVPAERVRAIVEALGWTIALGFPTTRIATWVRSSATPGAASSPSSVAEASPCSSSRTSTGRPSRFSSSSSTSPTASSTRRS
jgi:hypothetical protein